MSYEPTVWKDGDLVTSAKLNKLEQGVANGGGVLVVHVDKNYRLDKTWQEIYDAELAVISLMEDGHKGVFLINTIYIENDTYCVQLPILDGTSTFSTSSPDDYPSFSAPSQEPSE